jgi:hypothetical protein
VVLVNSKRGRIKNRNMAVRPQVALEIQDPVDPFRHLTVRGSVVAVVEDGAGARLEALSRRYLGKPYPWSEPGEAREIFRIALTGSEPPRSRLEAPENALRPKLFPDDSPLKQSAPRLVNLPVSLVSHTRCNHWGVL